MFDPEWRDGSRGQVSARKAIKGCLNGLGFEVAGTRMTVSRRRVSEKSRSVYKGTCGNFDQYPSRCWLR